MEKKQNNAKRTPDQITAVAQRLWRAFCDNLKEWRDYLFPRREKVEKAKKEEHRPLAERLQKVREDMKYQLSSESYDHFPESDHLLIQLLFFLGACVPHLLSKLTDVFDFRRKKSAKSGARIRHMMEEMKLHPVHFLSGALAIAAVCALVSVFTVGVTVHYNGYHLGTVSGGNTVKSIVSDIEDVTNATLNTTDYQVDTSLLETKMALVMRSEVQPRETVEESLTDQIGLVEEAYALYVNDELVVATEYPGALEELLEQLKIGYRTPNTVDCYFTENVEIRHEFVDAQYIQNLGHIAELLYETKAGEVTYTVKAGDSYYSIADENEMSLEDLYNANPGYDPSLLRVGDVLTLSNAVPYLTVVNVEQQHYLQDVPYDVVYEEDATMYQGDFKVISKGEYGKADVLANVTYINGMETDRQVVASVTLVDPVTETQAQGTKERPSWMPTGSFRWPCNGVVTSRFGYRNTGIPGASTYHEGIDIGNGYGTPIYASDGGTVVYSGWRGGYGYLVIVDHMNGYQTYYAHCSKLLVSVGDHVYKGEQIARMGSTGVSSGNHLDFRINLNGTFLDPLKYL